MAYQDVTADRMLLDDQKRAAESVAPPGFGYRWTICAMLFAATTINYVDRYVLGLLAPTLQKEIGWSEADYGAIASWFSFAYAIGFLMAGRVMDRFGVKKGFAGAVVGWSLAAMSHALAFSATGFSYARAALGFGESGNFPGAIKTTAEWFPKKERAFATGIFNAGSNVGAILAPIAVPYITLNWGWRWAFIATGALGFVWLIAWLLIYETPEKHKRLSKAEFDYIRSDPVESVRPVGYLEVLKHRQAWAFVMGKLITDPVWWFYLFWLPKFLNIKFGITLATVAAPLIVIYMLADVGSIAGGWISSFLIKRGATVNRARKTALAIAAVTILPTMLAPQATSLWTAVMIVAVAASMHQWWSCNLYTLTSDMFPRSAVATVMGFGGFAGAMGGVGFQRLVGKILQQDPNAYGKIFIMCGCAYVLALLVIHLLVPRMEPAKLKE